MNKITKKTKLKLWVKVVILILSALLFLAGVLSVIYSFKPEQKQMIYNYTIEQQLDYSVYLKENNFFDVLYLPKAQVYPSYFIENIKVLFNYRFSSTKNSVIEAEYDITGHLFGEYQTNVGTDSKLWHREYQLLALKTAHINDQSQFNINEDLIIDYNYYNAIVTEFRKKIAVPMTSFFRVSFNIIMKTTVDGTEVIDERQMIIDIPLLKEAFTINETLIPKEEKLVYEKQDNQLFNDFKMIQGIIFLGLSFVGIIYSYKNLFKVRPKNFYMITISKILKDYGNIIIELENPLDEHSFKIIDVKSFKEMLELEEGLREPIMFYEIRKDHEGEFVLVNNNILYRYILKNK